MATETQFPSMLGAFSSTLGCGLGDVHPQIPKAYHVDGVMVLSPCPRSIPESLWGILSNLDLSACISYPKRFQIRESLGLIMAHCRTGAVGSQARTHCPAHRRRTCIFRARGFSTDFPLRVPLWGTMVRQRLWCLSVLFRHRPSDMGCVLCLQALRLLPTHSFSAQNRQLVRMNFA